MKKAELASHQVLPHQRELSERLRHMNSGRQRASGPISVMLYFPTPGTWAVGPVEIAQQNLHVDRVEVLPARPKYDSAAAARRLLFAAKD